MGDRTKYNADYRAKHGEEIRAKGRSWYARHSDEVKARRREKMERLKAENPEEYQRLKTLHLEHVRRYQERKGISKPLAPRSCAVCGKEFNPVRGNQVCCSEQCSKVRSRQAAVVRETKTCAFCGKEFSGPPKQKYCCPECYSSAASARAKEKYERKHKTNISIARIRRDGQCECAPQVGPVDREYDERMAWMVVYMDDPTAKFAAFKKLTARQQRLVAQFDRQRHRGAHGTADNF